MSTDPREQRLTFVAFSHRDRHGKPHGRFICVCGGERVALLGDVKRGRTRSCGCLKAETSVGVPPRHGHSAGYKVSAEYRAWTAMRTRCRNPRSASYHNYGGRGIKVCERWDLFDNFLADMGLKPSPQHSLDRFPNNDGNYEPGNCRWATNYEQQNNKRPMVKVKGAKLDRDKAREILRDNRPRKLIAADYNISVSNVGLVKTGRTWKSAR